MRTPGPGPTPLHLCFREPVTRVELAELRLELIVKSVMSSQTRLSMSVTGQVEGARVIVK